MKKALFALLVALVVAYDYFVEFKGEERKEKASHIFSTDVSSIQKFTITNSERAGEDIKVSLEKISVDKEDEDQWKIVSPIIDFADTTSVSIFLDQLTEQKSDIKLDEAEISQDTNTLEKYGLDNPIGSFQVTLEDKTSLDVKVGRVEGLNKKTYLMKKDNIWVGDSWWRSQLGKNPNEFRSKDVIVFNNPKKIIIKHRMNQEAKNIPSEMQFIKTETGWTLDGQARDAVEDYLETIKDLEVQEFVSRDASLFDNWVFNIIIQEDKLESFHDLKFAPIEGNNAYVYNMPRDVAIKLSKTSVESLFKDVEALVKDPEDPLKISSDKDKKGESKSIDQADDKSSEDKKAQEISPSTSQSSKDNG